MKCDQDLCLNFWYDFKKLLWLDELNPRVRCAFGNVSRIYLPHSDPPDKTSLNADMVFHLLTSNAAVIFN